MSEGPPALRDQFDGRLVSLVPVMPDHTDFLYELAMDQANFGWRYAGTSAPKEAFLAQLWPGVLCQFVVVTTKSRRMVGLVVAYNANLHLGHVYIGGVALPQIQGKGVMQEAFRLLLKYLRGSWRITNLYFEYPEYNEPQFASGIEGQLAPVAKLRDHTFYANRYWDQYIYCLNWSTPEVNDNLGGIMDDANGQA